MELSKGRAGRTHLALLGNRSWCNKSFTREPPWAAGGKCFCVSPKMQTPRSIFLSFFLNDTSSSVVEGAYFYGHGSEEPGTCSLHISELVACYSPRLHRELLARKEFAGWAPSNKPWRKQMANSLEKGVMALQKPARGKRSLQEPCPKLLVGCPHQQDGAPGERGCLQHQQDTVLRVSPLGP